jgi:C1A family cysteine protease
MTTQPIPGVYTQPAAHYRLGFKNANPDLLGRIEMHPGFEVAPLPASVDLSAAMPPVGDQGQEGSCVAWASAYAMRGYEARKDVWSAISPKNAAANYNFSPAFVYNQINGGKDDGSVVTDALSLMETKGAATLADMPYTAGSYTAKPSAAAFSDALNYKIASYVYIPPTSLSLIKTQLAEGIPVILAIKVYGNFFSLGNNQVYSSVSGGYQGGHAITIVGYNDAKRAVEIINSWGTYWGTSGYGWISYAMLNTIGVEAYSAIDVPATPAPAPSSSPTATLSPSPLPTSKPSPTPTPKPSPTPTPKPSPTATPKK